MAKITRFTQKIFGSGAGVDQVAVFGSLFAGVPTFTTVASTAQSLSNWLTGWFGAAIGGNAPAIEDMNAPFFVLSTQLAYLGQAGVAEWVSDTTYYIGSIVNVAGVLYVSLTDDNLNNAVTDTANWKRFSGAGAVQSKSANYTIGVNDSLVSANAGSGAFQLTLPAVSAATAGQPIRIKKVDGTVNAVTIAADGADLIDGDASITLTVPNEGVTLVPSGSGSWLIF